MPPIIRKLKDLGNRYSVLFCDVWGCLHNGMEVFKAAEEALNLFRKSGGMVILLTNAPRPSKAVGRQLQRIGLSETSYDYIVTAGDAALKFIKENNFGEKIHHIGPVKDKSFFDTLFSGSSNFSLSSLQEAHFIVCTGLLDDQNETPDQYEGKLKSAVDLGLPMVCTNPDISVDFGNKRLFCAGAIASSYEEIGGEVYYFGKPHKHIYNYAHALLKKASISVNNTEILCIGDGLHTDIKGANSEKIHSLFVANGLEKENLIGKNGLLGAPILEPFFRSKDEKPDYIIEILR